MPVHEPTATPDGSLLGARVRTARARHPRLVGAALLALALLVLALRVVAGWADATLVALMLPIALCAGEWGTRAGLAAGVVATAIVAVADLWMRPIHLGLDAHLSRASAFVVVGGLLGHVSSQRRHLTHRLQTLRAASLDIIATADFNGYLREVNPAFERTLGWTAQELCSRPFVEFIHPDDREGTMAEAAALARGGVTVNFLNRYRCTDGSYRWLNWSGRAVPEEQLIYATARDVTAQRLAEHAMESQQRLLEAKVRERTAEVEQARLETLRRLALAAEYRDDDTLHHTQRVGHLAGLLAERIGLPEEAVSVIRMAAPLHDVGKLGISDTILLKPGPLTPDETEVMRRHVTIGAAILAGSRSRVLQTGAEIAISHHERWDGTGYPYRLRREAIPLAGRIVAIADVFDALTHDRPYKQAWPVERAVAEIRSLSGSHFDPLLVEAFAGLDHERLTAELEELREPRPQASAEAG